MPLDPAIISRQEALLRIVAGVFAMVGLVSGIMPETIRREVHRAALALLRPAEAAARRLILAATEGMDLTLAGGPPFGRKARSKRRAGKKEKGKAAGDTVPAFRLFDPRREVGVFRRPKARGVRVTVFGVDDHLWTPFGTPRKPMPDDPLSATRLCLRLRALRGALEDLRGEAARLARALARPSCKWLRPMRPGRPPGHVARGRREIDRVLRDCHILALWRLDPPKTLNP